jgi:hypothetical protein
LKVAGQRRVPFAVPEGAKTVSEQTENGRKAAEKQPFRMIQSKAGSPAHAFVVTLPDESGQRLFGRKILTLVDQIANFTIQRQCELRQSAQLRIVIRAKVLKNGRVLDVQKLRELTLADAAFF